MQSIIAGAEDPRVSGTDPISPMQLAHLVLRAPNDAAMRDFYKTFLNAIRGRRTRAVSASSTSTWSCFRFGETIQQSSYKGVVYS
jgi:hypothetical protein